MKKNNSVGEILRKHREEKGLLLRQMAALLDIDTAILSKIERGERKAKKEQIVQLAKILQDEELGEKALKVAEQKIKYNNTKNKEV